MGSENIPEGIYLRIKKAVGLASTASLLLQESRLNTCNFCEHLVSDLGVKRCGLCSCILELKTLVPDEHCKINKW